MIIWNYESSYKFQFSCFLIIKHLLTSAAVRAITGTPTRATVMVASRLGTRAAKTTRPVNQSEVSVYFTWYVLINKKQVFRSCDLSWLFKGWCLYSDIHYVIVLIFRAGRNEQLSPVLETVTDCLSSLLEILTYRGKIIFLDVEITI